MTAQSWPASASTTAVRAPPRRCPASCSRANACSAQPVSVEVAISDDRSPASGPPPRCQRPAQRHRDQVGGDDRQRDRGAARGPRVVGEVEAARPARTAMPAPRAIVGTIRSLSRRAAAAGPTKTATTSRLPRPCTATTTAAASRISSAASTRAGETPSARAEPRSNPVASRRACSSQSPAATTATRAAAEARSASVGAEDVAEEQGLDAGRRVGREGEQGAEAEHRGDDDGDRDVAARCPPPARRGRSRAPRRPPPGRRRRAAARRRSRRSPGRGRASGQGTRRRRRARRGRPSSRSRRRPGPAAPSRRPPAA